MDNDHPLLHRDWQVAYRWVEEQAKAFLDSEPEGKTWGTAALAELIYTGQSVKAQQRVFKALAAAATHGMQRYVTLGEPKLIGGKTGRPKLWHRPGAEIIPPNKPVCGECGRPL